MNQNLALRILSQIMEWDSTRSRDEFAWLSLMARLKYDGYRGFSAGARFLESLAYWLQQFTKGEREAAYAFVREALVYLGPQELHHLVELFFPEVVQKRLVRRLAQSRSIPPYSYWSLPTAEADFRALLRRTLFMGLSDGARIDAFRRENEGVVTNEQVVVATEINEEKWASLRENLQSEQGPQARFDFVFLIDDFTGSGKTLLRHEGGAWKGKLQKFWSQIGPFLATTFADDFVVCVHHYVASEAATRANSETDAAARSARGAGWFPRVEFTYGATMPESALITRARFASFCDLVEKYYDPSIETDSTRKGGTDAKYGFAQTRLALILEHNTPNNSIALLWAETRGHSGSPAMRPLFRRRQRHTT